jgi:enoyl-CoA hydratase
MSDGDEVLYREEGALAYITLNRPDKLNALSPTVFRLLDAALARLESSAAAQLAILHGTGRAFAAGADIEHYLGLTLGQYIAFERLARPVYDRIASCPKPIIAAVQGYALGGGFELLLACDMVVAATNARMGLPEAKLGLLPGGGGTQRLPRLIGRVRANELLMSARFLGADEALAWGLVNRVVAPEELLGAARALAESILPQAPLAVRMAKRLVAEGLEMPLAAALSYEQDATATLYPTGDAQEGIAAFVEKRPPRFEGH